MNLAKLAPPGQKTYREIRGAEERELIARAQQGDNRRTSAIGLNTLAHAATSTAFGACSR